MKNRGQFVLGGLLLLAGLLYLIAIVFQIDLRGSVWAILLILLGVWLLVRPAVSKDSRDQYLLFGDVVRSGRWKVESETFWMLIGDVKLDLTQAELPPGETVIRANMLIGDMKVIAPPDLPLIVDSGGLIHEINLFGQKQDAFLAPIEMQTPAYAGAERRIRLEATSLIGGLKVKAG
ncbi:MAG: cell wall-active antibiotics response protein LiaF [Anaerolineaceae bacterium]